MLFTRLNGHIFALFIFLSFAFCFALLHAALLSHHTFWLGYEKKGNKKKKQVYEREL